MLGVASIMRRHAPARVSSLSRACAAVLVVALVAACGEGFRTTAPSGAASETPGAAPPATSAPSPSPSPTSASTSHPTIEEVAKRFLRNAAACNRTAALADVGNGDDAHEIMTQELDRTAVDEETAHFLDKQCKRLGGTHHGEIVDAHVEGSRHLSTKKEHYLVRDVDIVAVSVTVRADGKAAERVTLHFFETSRGWRFTPRP